MPRPAILLVLLAITWPAVAQDRTNPRLYPWDGSSGDRVGERRLYREQPRGDAKIFDGIIVDWSEKLIKTAAGPMVPAQVQLAVLQDDGTRVQRWVDAPYFVGRVRGALVNLRLTYFDASDRVVVRLSVRDEMGEPAAEIKRRLAEGELWLWDNATPGLWLSESQPSTIPITAEQREAVTSVVWESWVDDGAAKADWLAGMTAKLADLKIDSPELLAALALDRAAPQKTTGGGIVRK